ncbi:hypothetical protein M885DRAFT_499622 [Pelagophyceae sp. CCMP2097]|nr:hypothetical protein M885DRAFT_499622 [Pelagophyceae sp. CCMP2097]
MPPPTKGGRVCPTEPHSPKPEPPRWRKLPRAPDPKEFWGGIPGSGCAVSVVAAAGGFEFELRARVDVRVVALLDVVEADNVFKAQLRVSLEWEVSEAQWAGCVDFWTREYVPRLRLFFKNGETRFNVLDPDHADGQDEVGTELVNQDGETLRFFRLQRRVTETFRQTFDLRAFPFDLQQLAIELEAEPTVVLGRTYNLVLEHPGGAGGSEGRHVICENADGVDDAAFETLYALDGVELAGPGKKRLPEYVVLLYVSRNFRSTLWNLIVPTLVIEFLSFLTYWVNPCQLADRAAVTVTLFLTAVSFKTYTASMLPAVPYLTSVEKYLMVCFLILALQALLLILAAKFCNPDGIKGQVMLDRYRKHVGVDPYWSEDVRTRLQNVVDSAALILTMAMIVVSFLVYILGEFIRLERRCAELHRMKKAAESRGAVQFSEFEFMVSRVIATRFPRLVCRLFDIVDPRTAPPRLRSSRALSDTEIAASDAPAAARYCAAVDFFRLQQKTPTVGYENPQIEVVFTASRPPTMAARSKSRAARARTAERAAIIDAGTGETKMLLASYTDNGPDKPPDVVLEDHQPFMQFGQGKSPLLDLCLKADLKPFEDWLVRTLRPALCVDVAAILAQPAGNRLLSLLGRHAVLDAAEAERNRKMDAAEAERRLQMDEVSGASKPDKAEAKHRSAWNAVEAERRSSRDTALALERCPALDAAFGLKIRLAGASKHLFHVKEKVKGVRKAENAALEEGMACRFLNGQRFSEELCCAQLLRCAALLDSKKAQVALAVGDRVSVTAGRPLRYAVAAGGEPVLVSRDAAATFVVWPETKGNVAAVLGTDLVEVAWDEPQGGAAATVVHRYDRSDARHFGALAALAEVQLSFALFADAEGDKWREIKLVLGTGAWFRKADAETRATFLDMVSRLEKRFKRCEMICLTALDEAHCEDLSIQYAHQCRGYDVPDASLAVGNGSTQLVAIEAPGVGADVIFDDVRLATVLAREKKFITLKGYDRFTYVYSLCLCDAADGAAPHAPGAVVNNVELCRVRLNTTRGRGTVPKAPHLIALGNTLGIETFRNCGDCNRTFKELQTDWRDFATERVTQAIRDQEIPAGTFKSVCAISACFYAADAAKLKLSKDGPTTVTVKDARAAFRTELDDTLRICGEYKAEHPELTPTEILKKPEHKGFELNLSNLTYQMVLCDLLFDDNTKMHFCRDWKIQDKKFRTTWSSGWFLESLVRSKVELRSATSESDNIHKGFCGLV